MTQITLRQTFHLIKSDLAAAIRYRGGKPGVGSALGQLLSPAGFGLAIWRWQAFLGRKHVPFANRILSILNLVLFSLEIEPELEADEGLVLLNPAGIMLHGHTRIGRNCILVHQITTSLGPRIGFDPINDFITIGDRVVLSAGVRIIGNLSIGSDTWVGPNTVVTDSIPSRSLVLGRNIQPRPDGENLYESPAHLAPHRR